MKQIKQINNKLGLKWSNKADLSFYLFDLIWRQRWYNDWSRFSRADPESVNALLQTYTVSAIEEGGNEKHFVAPDTKAERDRIWEEWTDVTNLSSPNF